MCPLVCLCANAEGFVLNANAQEPPDEVQRPRRPQARSGNWKTHGRWHLNIKMLADVAGIVGLRSIGREVANRLVAFKMDIRCLIRSEKQTPGWTRHAGSVSLARAVDFLIVSIVGGEPTRGFV